jgi:hypothetical protein
MIITRTEVKSLLKITDTDWDSFIDMNIPIIEQVICDYCNNDFIDKRYDWFSSNGIAFVNATNEITFTNIGNKDLIAGDSIRIYRSKRNNQSFTIDTVNSNSLILNDIDTVKEETADDVVYLTKLDYPKPLKLTVSKMMKFLMSELDNNKTPGAKSEKIDDYSITYEDDYQGFPLSIMKFLNSYRYLYKIDLFNYTRRV